MNVNKDVLLSTAMAMASALIAIPADASEALAARIIVGLLVAMGAGVIATKDALK